MSKFHMLPSLFVLLACGAVLIFAIQRVTELEAKNARLVARAKILEAQLAAANQRVAELSAENERAWESFRREAKYKVIAEQQAAGLEAQLAIQSRALKEAREIARVAAELVSVGLRSNGEHLIVVEERDKSDPHYRLCGHLEMAGLIPPSPATLRRRAAQASGEGGE